MRDLDPVSQHFPPEVRGMLMRAASIDDPAARLRAVNAAIDRARLLFPHLFREDDHADRRRE